MSADYCVKLWNIPYLLIGPGRLICHLIGCRQLQLYQLTKEGSQIFNKLQSGVILVCFNLSFIYLLEAARHGDQVETRVLERRMTDASSLIY